MASIVQLQYAVELDRQKSFQKAAKKCFVTQPTLSMQLQKLEEELDIVLFDRSRKPIAPTAEGQVLLEQFRKVIEEFARIEQLANQQKGKIGGEYRLAVIPTIAPNVLPPFLKRFRSEYPDVKVTAIEMTTDEIIAGLKTSAIDAGILSTPLHDTTINEKKLFLEPLYIFHSPEFDLPLNKDGEVDVETLPLEKMLVLTEGNCLRTQVLDLCTMRDEMRRTQGFDIEASSMMTLMNLVQNGDFFTIIPHLAMQGLTAEQQKSQIKPFANISPVREVGVVTHRSQVKERIDQAAFKVLSDLLPNEIPLPHPRQVLEPI